jgi:hypothetical protein
MSKRFIYVAIAVALITGITYWYFTGRRAGPRLAVTYQFFGNPASVSEFDLVAGTRCGSAPFAFPTNGFIGFIWDDSFRVGHRHSGLDIFSGTEIGVTPVYNAYPGYLSRLPDWKSTVIVRVPNDPLDPSRQIWVYYTHMADEDGNSFVSEEFPKGTSEVYVDTGTLLGYQGDYSGDPNNPVGVHLHISIVKDDGGSFLNETDINNTYDPSPYFGMQLNANNNSDTVPTCKQ